MTFNPPVEIPMEVLAWMQKQSHSAFIGAQLDMNRRNGGISQKMLDEVMQMMNNSN